MVKRYVLGWREPGNVSICNLCHRHQTPDCPFLGATAPAQGYCPQFSLGVKTVKEAEDKIVADIDNSPPLELPAQHRQLAVA